MKPAKGTVAAPVMSKSGLEKIRGEADDTVFAALPERFFSVGEFYGDFPQVSDEEVRHLLLESRIQSAGPAKEISQGRGSY
jgi:putative phosphoribosyl transferase